MPTKKKDQTNNVRERKLKTNMPIQFLKVIKTEGEERKGQNKLRMNVSEM